MACRAGDSPPGLAERYAQALKDDRLADAYALTSAQFRAEVPFEVFARRFGSPAERSRRVEELQAAQQWRSAPGGLIAVEEDAAWRLVEPELSGRSARAALEAFLAAADARDFAAAYRLLAGPWRAVYTPQRLAEDFAAEPSARERLARARAALAEELRWVEGGAELPLGEGRSVRLVREGGVFKVAALE